MRGIALDGLAWLVGLLRFGAGLVLRGTSACRALCVRLRGWAEAEWKWISFLFFELAECWGWERMCEGFLADCLCVAVAVSVGRGDVGYGTFLSDWAGGPGKVSAWIGLDWIGWWYLKKERVEEEVGKQARGWEGLK